MGNKTEKKNKQGRPARYMTIERFEQWLGQDFFHLCVDVRVIKWGLGILAGLTIAILIKIFLG